MIYGIDVSRHNGKINWQKVKASGKTFAFIRVGWAGYDGAIAGNGGLDSLYHQNIQGAIAAGLDVGVYVYSYTKSPSAAVVAAREVLELVKPYKLTYPIAFDIEETTDKCLLNQGKDGLSITAKAFLTEIENVGYYGMLYTYTSFATAYLNMSLLKQYDTWIADYREPTGTNCPYPGSYGIWQYLGDNGRCNGVVGGCDINIAYKDYAKIIKDLRLNSSDKINAPEFQPPTKDIRYNLEIRDIKNGGQAKNYAQGIKLLTEYDSVISEV